MGQSPNNKGIHLQKKMACVTFLSFATDSLKATVADQRK